MVGTSYENSGNKTREAMYCTCNTALRRVRATVVAMENKVQ